MKCRECKEEMGAGEDSKEYGDGLCLGCYPGKEVLEIRQEADDKEYEAVIDELAEKELGEGVRGEKNIDDLS